MTFNNAITFGLITRFGLKQSCNVCLADSRALITHMYIEFTPYLVFKRLFFDPNANFIAEKWILDWVLDQVRDDLLNSYLVNDQVIVGLEIVEDFDCDVQWFTLNTEHSYDWLYDVCH
jgi:hypothetical protein